MTRERLISQLEEAANTGADLRREDLQILLRRAALALRNLGAGLAEVREKVDRVIDEQRMRQLIEALVADSDGPSSTA